MITEINEHDFDLSLTLKPENKEELAMLYRCINNAKKVKPDLYLSFGKDNVYANIRIVKIAKHKQFNSIVK